MSLVVLGGQGAGEIAAHAAMRSTELEFGGYLNDTVAPGQRMLGGEVIGRFEDWRRLPEPTAFVAPLHKVKQMAERQARIEALAIPPARWGLVVDPAAVIAPGAEIGRGGVVSAFAVVGPGCRAGAHAAFWPGAQLGHDVTVGDFVFLGRAAVVSGYCRIGEGAYIGAGAMIREGCTVGRYAVVAMGAVVLSDVPDFALVAGVPARARPAGNAPS